MELYEIYYSSVGCTITDDEGIIKYQKGSSDKFVPNSGYVLDLHNYPEDVLELTEDNLSFYEVLVNYHKNEITGEEFGKFSVEETEEYIAKDMKYSSVVIGNGVIAEFMLSQQVIEYSYELEHPDVKGLRAEYDCLLEEYRQFITDIESEIKKGDSIQIKEFEQEVKEKLQNLKNAYTTLVIALEKALMEDYMIGG
jgi:nucleoid DNA-binding protein